MVSFSLVSNLLYRWLSFGTIAEADASEQNRPVVAGFSEELQPKDVVPTV